MPYIEPKPRVYFDEHPHEAKEDGDLAYVMYKHVFLPMWKKEPRWKTYALMRKGLRDVRLIDSLKDLVIGLAKNGADMSAVSVAATCAVDEIKRKYVDDYERLKIEQNGDIE